MSCRIAMAAASWIWFTSFVILVTRDGVPMRSISAAPKLLIFLKSAFLRSVPTPCETFEATCCVTSVEQYPAHAMTTRRMPRRTTYSASCVATPTSIMSATIRGVITSKTTSTVLKSMPTMVLRRYFLQSSCSIRTPVSYSMPSVSESSSHSSSRSDISFSAAASSFWSSMRCS